MATADYGYLDSNMAELIECADCGCPAIWYILGGDTGYYCESCAAEVVELEHKPAYRVRRKLAFRYQEKLRLMIRVEDARN